MEVKEGYKLTEVGVIPEDWKVAQLDKLCHSICDGTHFTPEYVSQGIPFYSVENITTDDFVNTKFITPEEHAKLTKRCNPKKGDILMSRITAGILGDTKLIDWDVEASIYVSLALLRPNESVSSKYLYRYTQFSAFRRDVELQGLSNATPKKINMQDIGKIPIPLPPTKAEQEAIAEALSDADALIQSLEQLIAKKRQIKQGAMQELLTGKKRVPGFTGEWERRTLGSVGKFLKGNGIRKHEANSGPIPCIRYGEIYTRHENYVRKYYSNISVDVAAMARRLKKGDLLFTGSGETREEIGKCIALLDDIEVYAGGDIVILRPMHIDSLFFGYYLNTPMINEQKASKGQGDAVVHISANALAEIYILIPSSKEQTAIATILSDMDREITALETKLSKARQIKQGMMQELLTGKIRLVSTKTRC